jgi:hypothetical protein
MITVNRNVQNFWDYLSDAWTAFENKAEIEVLWEAIASGIDYTMAKTMDVQNSRSLLHMPHLIEDGPVTFTIQHSGLESSLINTYPSEYPGALFKYYLDDWVVSMPFLQQTYSYVNTTVSHTYTYGADYMISGLNTLHWLTPPYWDERYSNIQVLTVTAPQVKRINPSLMGLWARAVDLDINEFTSYNTFKPVSDDSKYKHLKYFIWALASKKLALPTIKNMQDALAIAYGMPFAYTAGTLTYQQTGDLYTVNVGTEEYTVSGLTVLASGTVVEQFDPLTEDILLYDYYNNPSLVEQHSNILTRYNTLVIKKTTAATINAQYNNAFALDYISTLLPIHFHVYQVDAVNFGSNAVYMNSLLVEMNET